MAINIEALRQDLLPYGNEVYVDYNENHNDCFMIVMENCIARLDQKTELDTICDSYLLADMPRATESTLVSATYKRGYQS